MIAATPMKWLVYKELYLERLETRSPKSEHPKHARAVLDRFTKRLRLYERDLDSIRDIDLETYIRARRGDTYRDRPLTVTTINGEIQILNTCFALAGPKTPRGPGRKNWQLIPFPPYAEPMEDCDRNPVVISEEQIEAFSRATSFARTPRYGGVSPQQFWHAALVLDAITALRRGALLDVLRPSDKILIERRELPVPAEISKTKREQIIALGSNEKVFDLLSTLPGEPGEPLLPWRRLNGQPMSRGHFSNEMARFQREAGIPESERIKTKHMRSTAATKIGEAFSEAIAKKRLGHTPGSKTWEKHYQGRGVSSLDHQASDQLADFIAPLLDSAPRISIVG